MNQIDFLKYNQFPTSGETFSALQSMINLIAKIASLGGINYILDGCTESGNNVSVGTVVVNGEILTFAGGPKSTYVVISETKQSVQVYENLYSDIYKTRQVIFGTGTGQLAWSSFKSFTDLLTLATNLNTLSTSFATHVNNHSVAWGSVSAKPSVYPPASHAHAWADIGTKPLSTVYLGQFNATGTSVTKFSGTLTVTISKSGTGTYTLIHNIGHTNYIILGVGYGSPHTSSLRAMDDIANNSCKVYTSDDSSLYDTAIRFVIITF